MTPTGWSSSSAMVISRTDSSWYGTAPPSGSDYLSLRGSGAYVSQNVVIPSGSSITFYLRYGVDVYYGGSPTTLRVIYGSSELATISATSRSWYLHTVNVSSMSSIFDGTTSKTLQFINRDGSTVQIDNIAVRCNNCSCYDCPIGQGSRPGSIQCYTCSAGQYSTGGAPCMSCPAGQGSSAGSGSCYVCPAGQYSTGGTPCMNCPAGYYSLAGSSNCTACPAGLGTWTTGLGSCRTCFSGQYSTGGTSCQDCPGGYSSYQGSRSCSTCRGGKQSLTCGSVFVSNTKDFTDLSSVVYCQ